MGSGEAAIILVIVGAIGSLALVGLSAGIVYKVRGNEKAREAKEKKTLMSCPVCARPLPQLRIPDTPCLHCLTVLDKWGRVPGEEEEADGE